MEQDRKSMEGEVLYRGIAVPRSGISPVAQDKWYFDPTDAIVNI